VQKRAANAALALKSTGTGLGTVSGTGTFDDPVAIADFRFGIRIFVKSNLKIAIWPKTGDLRLRIRIFLKSTLEITIWSQLQILGLEFGYF